MRGRGGGKGGWGGWAVGVGGTFRDADREELVQSMTAESALALGVCTYNRGPKLAETLAAIARMDRAGGRVRRLVIIDNNSSDETGTVADRFCASDPPIPARRVIEPVQGLAAARARFVNETDEPLLALIDDDCLPDPAWARAVLSIFDSRPRAGIVGGRVELAWESGPTRLARRCATMLAEQDLGDAPQRIDHPERGLVGVAMAIRRGALVESGWIECRELTDRTGRELTSGGDYELAIRVRAAGWETWYTPDARARHVIGAERQSTEYLARLARGVSLSRARLRWLAAGRPGVDWVRVQARRARIRWTRSTLLEWRPGVRTLKQAEHRARCEGWDSLVRELEARGEREPSSAR